FERSTRFWLRAYPVRWRAVRGDELLGVLRDLAGPDATRLPLREGLGLVRAGWATRWREGPPLRTRLAYRWLERPIPPRYREWARDDIDGRWYDTRRMLLAPLGIFVIFWLVPVLRGRTSDLFFVLLWAMILPVTLWFDLLRPVRDPYRTRAVNRHLMPRAGEPRTATQFGQTWGTRPRLGARLGTTLACLVLGLGAALWTTVALVAPRGPAIVGCPPEPDSLACFTFGSASWHPQRWAAVAAVAVVVGLLLAYRAGGRAARLLSERPAQPYRALANRAPGLLTVLALVIPLAGWQAWLEVTGHWATLIAPGAAATCLLMLPGALVAHRVARHGPSDLALVDLWQIGVHGRAPQVDTWVVAVVRVSAVTLDAGSPTGDGPGVTA
ncbi:MAG: hypothetical protein L6367_06150, partial [Cellulomonas sp.]|nr:hypothetical protein [Cellulomonas sp.]